MVSLSFINDYFFCYKKFVRVYHSRNGSGNTLSSGLINVLIGDSTHKMKREELNAFIQQAFKESIYPGDDNIVCDNSERHIDCHELREQLKGKTWLKVSEQVLQNIKSETAFFSESGMYYYLPAFMLFIVNDFEKADTLTHDVVSLLTLPAEIDVIIVANKIKSLKLDKQLSEIDFSNFLTQHLEDINDNVKRFIRFGSLLSLIKVVQ